jgi:hypothetical protein
MGDMQIVCKADEIGLDDAFINLNARALPAAVLTVQLLLDAR